LFDPAEVESLRRRQVEAFANLAHRSDGLARFAHLGHAVELAEGFGFTELADELRAEAESMTDDELGLHKVAAEVTIPQESIDKWIQEIVGDDQIEEALLRFGSIIPSDDPGRTRRFVKESATETPLLSIIPTMKLGPENALLRTVNADDHEEQAVIDHETLLTSFFGLVAAEMLEAIRARYGALAPVAESLFQNFMIDEATARHLAKCVELYEEGRYNECAHMAVPRIERILRGLARSIGFSVTRSPGRDGSAGGVLGLGAILWKLQGVMVEPSCRYLTVLLTRETGINLRNRLSHGLIDEVRQWEAA